MRGAAHLLPLETLSISSFFLTANEVPWGPCQNMKTGGSAYLGGVDELVSKGLLDALEVAEGGLAGALDDQVDRLVDSAEGGDVHSLSAHSAARADTGRVLTSATLLDGGDDDLDGVFSSQEMNQFKCLLNDSDGVLLLTVGAAAGGHEHVDEALDNGALDLLELALLVAARGVGNVNLLLNSLDLEVTGETDVTGFDAIVGPLAEQLGLESEFGLSVVVLADFGSGIRLVFLHHLFEGCNVPI